MQPNIQHRTSNIRHPMLAGLAVVVMLSAGCATSGYKPSEGAKAQIKAVDTYVANLVAFEFDRCKASFEDGENLANYFGLCAVAIGTAGTKATAGTQSPGREEVQAAVSGIRIVGYTPEALAVVCGCLDYYTPLADGRDSGAVLAEIAQEIRMGCPGGYPWWYLPRPKVQSPKPEVQSPKASEQ